MKVFKYSLPIPIEDHFTLDLPKGARVLCVQVQYERPWIWALVEPKEKFEPRTFRLAGTGHEIAGVDSRYAVSPMNCGRYIGTFQLHGGALVFHLFDLESEEP